MSGTHLSRKSLTSFKLAAAAIASVVGFTPAIAHAASTTQPIASTTTRPAPSGTALGPSVHWFAAWNEGSVAENPINAFSAVTTYTSTPQGSTVVPPPTTAPSKDPISAKADSKNSVAAKDKDVKADGKKPVAVKANKPAPVVAPAPTYQVPVTGHGISYLFADFESNRYSLRSSPQDLTAHIPSATAPRDGTFSAFEATLLNTAQGNDSTHSAAFFLTKGQYDILHVSMANAALYPSATPIRSLADALASANLQAQLSMDSGARLTPAANANHAKALRFEADEKLYRQRVAWIGQLRSLTTVSLKANEIAALGAANGTAKGYKFPTVAGFPQLDKNTKQLVAMGNLSGPIAHYRLRGAYAANAFEVGVLGYSVADQESDIPDNSYDIAAVDLHKPEDQRATMAFNPIVSAAIVDASNNPESRRSDETSDTIWSGDYAATMNSVDVAEYHPLAANFRATYRTADVYDVFARTSAASGTPVYAAVDVSTPPTSGRALADASMQRLLEFNPSGARDYKGTSVAVSDGASQPMSIFNGRSQTSASNPGDRGFTESMLFATLAAAGSLAVLCRRRRRGPELAI